MKSRLTLLAICAILLSGCGMDIDWCPVSLSISIQSPDGTDLLDPDSESFIGDKVTLTYQEADFTYTPTTKTYLPTFYGLKIYQDSQIQKYRLHFGELDGGQDYDDDFILTLPNGTTRTIHYTRTINSFTISAHEKWTLDGHKATSPILITY